MNQTQRPPSQTNLQRHAIYSVLREKAYDLLNSIHAEWIYHPEYRDVWDHIMLSAMDHSPLNPDGVKDWVNKSGLHEFRKSAIIATISEICDGKEMLVQMAILPESLHKAYQIWVIESLKERISKYGTTLDMKGEAVAEAHKALTEASGGDTLSTLGNVTDGLIDSMLSGADTVKVTKSIDLRENKVLAEMFGNRIWPDPYIIGAREKFRKTQTVINLINYFGSHGRPGIFYTFEDSAETCGMKSLAIEHQIPYEEIVSNSMKRDRIEKLKEVAYKRHGKNILIDPKSYRPLDWAKQVRMQCLSRRVDWIAIDFVQSFSYDRNREKEELSQIGKLIREICKEFVIPCITLSQVNENSEDVDTGEVKLHVGNLKGSGSLKEDARFIYVIDGKASEETLNWKCVKGSFGLYWKKVLYHGPSGKILEVMPF